MSKKISGEGPRHRCSYRDCTNGPYQNGKTLFRFPKQFSRLHEWLTNCGNERLNNLAFETIIGYGICGDHFPDSAFRTADKLSIYRDSIPLPFNRPKLQASSAKSPSNVGGITAISTSVNQDNKVDKVTIPVKRTRCDAGEKNPSSCLDHGNIAAAHERIPTVLDPVSQTRETYHQKLYTEMEELKRENMHLRQELKISKKIISRYRSWHNNYKLRSSAKQKPASKKKLVMSLVNEMTLAPAAKAMISLQLHTNKAPYSDEEINLAKRFHYYSPAALRRLRKAGCNFPSSATLKRY